MSAETTKQRTASPIVSAQPAARATLQFSAAKPAAAPVVAQRPASASHAPIRLQTFSKVSSPNDPAEREPDSTARKIMRMSIPEGSIAYSRTEGGGGVFRRKDDEKEKLPALGKDAPSIKRFADSGIFARKDGTLQRKGDGSGAVAPSVSAEIQNSMSSGSPLPTGVRQFMEPRFGANFSGVRIHTGDRAASLNRQVNAQAFAVNNHIFFGKDRFQPETSEGKELIAHELTHTIQQGSVKQEAATPAPSSATKPGTALARREDVSVTQSAPAQVQRLGISDALDYFADAANNIPGFRMFTIIIGLNPINMSSVDRSAANILRAMIELVPGGGLIRQALDNHGVFAKAGAWVEAQFKSLGMVGSSFRQALMKFLDSLGWRDIFRLGDVWDRAKRIFTEPISRIISFAGSLVNGIIQLIKDAILRPLAGLISQTRGYDLLKAVLGEDPVTGDPYPRNADTLIGGFMKLIGQEEVWNNIKKANAIARAWAWFQGALGGLMGFVRAIPGTFIGAFKSLELMDIVVLPRAFVKVGKVFANFLGQFMSWAGGQVMSLLQIIFEVVAPGAVPYIKKAAGAFQSIIRNPIGFVGNLVRAGIQGFRQFAGRFLTHLKASLIGWLTGTMAGAGIYIPQAFSMKEIIKFVLSVLGLTWTNIRGKLVRAVGETVVTAMETGFDIVKTLVTQGPAAAWEKIQESLSNLKDLVMEQIISFVQQKVVQKAITMLVSSLNPAGAFIQAIIAIYNTVMFFIERLKQIAQVAMSFIDSISAIASGAIGAAANRVEQTMAGLLTLVISFLARLAGLGKVSDAVVGIINKIRAPIDKALDKIVEWIVNTARKLGRFVAQAGLPNDPNERLKLGMDAALAAVNRFEGKTVGKLVIVPLLAGIKVRYGFKVLELEAQGGIWWVRGEINPTASKPSKHVKVGDGTTVSEGGGKLKTMPLIEISFNVKGKSSKGKPGLDWDEFVRQLDLQEKALNAMTIKTWIDRKTAFKASPDAVGKRDSKGDYDIKRLKAEFENLLNGVPLPPQKSNPDEDEKRLYGLRALAQQELVRMRGDAIKKNPDLAKPENATALNEEVRKKFKESAGLHRVDQIAGGDSRDIAGFGGEREDFSIGAAWAHGRGEYMSRVETIHAKINELVDPAVFPTANMNLKLTPKAT